MERKQADDSFKSMNDSLESNARHENKMKRDSRKEDVSKFLQRYSLSLPPEAKVKLASMEGAIYDLHQKIELEINSLANMS